MRDAYGGSFLREYLLEKCFDLVLTSVRPAFAFANACFIFIFLCFEKSFLEKKSLK